MKNLTIKQTAELLKSKDTILILTHRRPDGDTSGCAAALCRGLRSLGKTAWILENPQLIQKYRSYHQGLTISQVPQGAYLVSVDVASQDMLCMGAQALSVDLLLDHHGSNPGFASQGVIQPDAAACGEIILDLLSAMEVKLDKAMAEAVYVAISTDTGCFRYSNTTSRTLEAAAACLKAGADVYPINKALFETVRLSRLKLNAYMAQHLELLNDGRVALCPIPLAVEQETGVMEDDMEDVSNFARNIEGVELAVTFRTVENGDTKLSIRSSPMYDAAALAVAMGGGGHKAAAGATIHGDYTAARQWILELMHQQGIL